MANFTITLGELLEDDEFVIGLDKYPIWNESYRETLNEKIKEHFYYREIGAETPEMFVFFLNRKLNESMPEINKIYASIVPDDKIFQNADITVGATSTAGGTAHSQADAKMYDMPQTLIADSGGSGDHYQNLSRNISDSNSDSSSSNDQTTTGLQGTAASAAMEYRQAIVDCDLLVFQAIEPCFMQIFSFGHGLWL